LSQQFFDNLTNFKKFQVHEKHAVEIAKNFTVNNYDALAATSDNGFILEVISGLLIQHDHERALKMPSACVPQPAYVFSAINCKVKSQLIYNLQIIPLIEPFSPRGIFCTEMAIMLARPRYLPLRINHVQTEHNGSKTFLRGEGVGRLLNRLSIECRTLRTYHHSSQYLIEKSCDLRQIRFYKIHLASSTSFISVELVRIILIGMHFIYFFFLFFQLSNIQTTLIKCDIATIFWKLKILYNVKLMISYHLSANGPNRTVGFVNIKSERGRRWITRLTMFQTKPLDLSIPKLKDEGNKSQGLSVDGVSDEEIKPRQQLVPIETLMEVMELSKQRECLRKKWRCNLCQKEVINKKEHLMTHTGEKPCSCPICGK
uniref:C2H2-type domain-containing protein n=1 Tax=Brugia timori TaxID=42155 RepID=A0A0R3R1N6_9BILA